jgi:molybdopterin-containing oxidoreductase family membrane subunit
MTLLWFYFTFAEYLTVFYSREPVQMAIFWSKVTGGFAPHFWAMFFFCFVVPLPILAFRKTRTIGGTLIASLSVMIGMWLERYVIIVPTLTQQRLATGTPFYSPTWVEWSILAGCVSCFILLYMVFTKFFPIVSIWEIREGREKAVTVVSRRIRSYLPEQDTVEGPQ